LIDNLKDNQIENEVVQEIEMFLTSCDLVKFAKYIPQEKENTLTTELAFKIIEDTKMVFAEELASTEKADVDKVKPECPPAPESIKIQDTEAKKLVAAEADLALEKEGGELSV
jgi:hypothetical protein